MIRFPFTLASVLLVAAVAGCAGTAGDVTVAVPPHVATQTHDALSGIGPVAVAVPEFREQVGTGVLPGRIGERKTLGNISLGKVSVTPLPGQIVADAFRTELVAAGARVVPSGGEATINGTVKKFSMRTDVTATYWDVIGATAVSVTAKRNGQAATSDYQANCKDRTYVYPGATIIGSVMHECVNDLARQFRGDRRIAHVLGQ